MLVYYQSRILIQSNPRLLNRGTDFLQKQIFLHVSQKMKVDDNVYSGVELLFKGRQEVIFKYEIN